MGAHQHSNGGARISTTQSGAAEHDAAPARTTRPTLSAGVLTGVIALLLGAALATAAPAAAVVDDPSRPDGRVTHGPSCRPGGLVVEVVAGTAPYTVRLATTRTPTGEDEAVLQPGETIVLRTGDVAYGETIDGRLEYAAQDGSGVTFVDELDEYSFTRPTGEDCAAVAAPSDAPTSTPAPSASSAPTTAGGEATGPSTGSSPTAAPSAGGAPIDGPPSGRPVTAGDSVTFLASGFQPGERVTIQLHGSGDVLGTATAGVDGTVQAEVRIPGGTETGPATMDLVGDDSAVVADVALQVAGSETAMTDGAEDLVPLTAAAVALVAAVGGLVSVAGRHRTRRLTIRSA
jgi:hypothetical protein